MADKTEFLHHVHVEKVVFPVEPVLFDLIFVPSRGGGKRGDQTVIENLKVVGRFAVLDGVHVATVQGTVQHQRAVFGRVAVFFFRGKEDHGAHGIGRTVQIGVHIFGRPVDHLVDRFAVVERTAVTVDAHIDASEIGLGLPEPAQEIHRRIVDTVPPVVTDVAVDV